jgi:hypothetical protein
MIDMLFEGRLKRMRGEPQVYDLTNRLGGSGTWQIRGWKIASTDEVEIYYSIEGSTFILIVLELGGQPNQAWYKDDLESAVATSREFLTPLDQKRLDFVLGPFINYVHL